MGLVQRLGARGGANDFVLGAGIRRGRAGRDGGGEENANAVPLQPLDGRLEDEHAQHDIPKGLHAAELVGEERMGRLSGWAWGLGYAGGLSCLILSLVFFVQADPPPGLDRDAERARGAVAPPGSVFISRCSCSLMCGAGLRRPPLREGLAVLWRTFTQIGDYRDIARFLLANMIYLNGLNTLFLFGGIYAAGQFGMDVREVLYFGILLNISAGLGAVAFAWLDDYIGAKPTILISLGPILLWPSCW
jgi:UMF1 family MFS transporter